MVFAQHSSRKGIPAAAMGDSQNFEDDDSIVEVPLTTCLRPPVPFQKKSGYVSYAMVCMVRCSLFVCFLMEIWAQAFNLRRLLARDDLQTSPPRTTRPTIPASARTAVASSSSAANRPARSAGSTGAAEGWEG